MTKRKDLKGKKFSNLTVASFHSSSENGKARWTCFCDCGKAVVVQACNLLSGHTKSCGCMRKYSPGYDENGKKTRLYRIWSQMKSRCENSKNKKYQYYGGKGVSVCGEWHNFINFHQWAINNGYQDDLSIDRIDPAGNYCPENCRWADSFVQGINRNRRHGAGVNWDKGRSRWRGRVSVKGKDVFCGYFASYNDAIEAVEKERSRQYAAALNTKQQTKAV